MNTKPRDDTQPRYGAVNASRKDHVKRLRNRIRNLSDTDETMLELRGILQGMLDVIEDDEGGE